LLWGCSTQNGTGREVVWARIYTWYYKSINERKRMFFKEDKML